MSERWSLNSWLPSLRIRDDWAYIAPMLVFGIFTAIGVQWPKLFIASYIVKTFATAAALILLRGSFTKIRWNFWWVGIVMGAIGVAQWVGMEKLLLHIAPNYPRLGGAVFDPINSISSPAARWAFVAIRWAGASLVVPFMEELFWRDFLWRTVIAPADFKLARVGEVDWTAIAIVSLLFATVHVQWITAVIWGVMIAGVLVGTQSLGACIVMHGVTNFLLGLYVLKTGDWYFW